MRKKKAEPLSEMKMPNVGELPEGWEVGRIADFSRSNDEPVQTGPFGAQLHASDYVDAGIPLLLIKNVIGGNIIENDIPRISLAKAESLSRYRLKTGDIVFSRVGSVGRVALIQEHQTGWLISGQMLRLRLENPEIDSKFLKYMIQTNWFVECLEKEIVGSTRKSINTKILRNLPLIKPPLAEQQRIVARVEALLTQVNAARDRLSRVPLIMKKFRQAVLAAACSGRLTEGWREENPDIKQKPCEKEGIEIPDDWNIPEEWQWSTIIDVCDNVVDCPHSTPKWTQSGKICIRTSDIKSCYLDLSQARYVSDDTYRERIQRLEPKEGDIVYSREGTFGQAAIIPNGVPICLGQRIMLLRSGSHCSPFFLMYLINSPQILKIVSELTTGSTSLHINVKDVKKFPIPLPPLAEQHEIVHRVGLLFERADAIDREVAAAGRRCERMTQAVLARAFAGKL